MLPHGSCNRQPFLHHMHYIHVDGGLLPLHTRPRDASTANVITLITQPHLLEEWPPASAGTSLAWQATPVAQAPGQWPAGQAPPLGLPSAGVHPSGAARMRCRQGGSPTRNPAAWTPKAPANRCNKLWTKQSSKRCWRQLLGQPFDLSVQWRPFVARYLFTMYQAVCNMQHVAATSQLCLKLCSSTSRLVSHCLNVWANMS